MATIPTAAGAAVAGAPATAAQYNYTRDAVTLLLDPPHADAIANAAQAVANNATPAVVLQVELEDNDAMFVASSSSSAMTVKTPGRFSIVGQLAYAANATGQRLLSIFVNGIEIDRLMIPAYAGYPTALALTTSRRLYVNDVVELRAFQNSGGTLNTDNGAGGWPSLRMTWQGK